MSRSKLKSTAEHASSADRSKRRNSIFNRTPLQSFFDNGGDLCNGFDDMAAAFESESGEAMGFSFSDEPKERFARSQPLKLSIIKTLLFVGVNPSGKSFPVIARLIEVLAVHPELDLDDVMSDFSETHYTTVDAVTRLIDKGLNMRDQTKYDRVTMLTESHPFTAKDALCDLSVFINIHY